MVSPGCCYIYTSYKCPLFSDHWRMSSTFVCRISYLLVSCHIPRTCTLVCCYASVWAWRVQTVYLSRLFFLLSPFLSPSEHRNLWSWLAISCGSQEMKGLIYLIESDLLQTTAGGGHSHKRRGNEPGYYIKLDSSPLTLWCGCSLSKLLPVLSSG